MKKVKKNLTKIKVKDLKTKLYAGNRSKFLPPKDYKANISLLHHCRYCKAFKFSKELSIYDGKLIYVCPECGGRHKYSMGKINFQRALKLIAMLFVAFCLLLIFADAQGTHLYDIFDCTTDTPEYDIVTVDNNNPFELDGETYKEFLFVAPKDGYYKFNSLDKCEPKDVNGKLIVDGEVVCENDNFAETVSFYMLKYLEEGQEVILAVDAHNNPMTHVEIQIKELGEKYASAVEVYIEASENGYYLSEDDAVYYEHSFYEDPVYYESADTRKAVSFYVEDDESYIWLAFSATDNYGDEIYVWHPVKVD